MCQGQLADITGDPWSGARTSVLGLDVDKPPERLGAVRGDLHNRDGERAQGVAI